MIADIACVFGWTEAECLGKPLDRLMGWHRRALERASWKGLAPSLPGHGRI